MSVRFDYNRRGGLTVDRDSLHESEGYKRQVEALKQLPERKAVMGEKMTLEQAFAALNYACEVICEYSPAGVRSPAAEKVMAAAATFRSHLAHPAQAVDVGAINGVIRELRKWPPSELVSDHRATRIGYADMLTAALPNANGKEG